MDQRVRVFTTRLILVRASHLSTCNCIPSLNCTWWRTPFFLFPFSVVWCAWGGSATPPNPQERRREVFSYHGKKWVISVLRLFEAIQVTREAPIRLGEYWSEWYGCGSRDAWTVSVRGWWVVVSVGTWTWKCVFFVFVCVTNFVCLFGRGLTIQERKGNVWSCHSTNLPISPWPLTVFEVQVCSLPVNHV